MVSSRRRKSDCGNTKVKEGSDRFIGGLIMGERVIRVTGKGRLRVRPDMTRITMTLEDVKKDYDKTLKASSEDTEALKSLLGKEGFAPEDIKTLSFNVDIENES